MKQRHLMSLVVLVTLAVSASVHGAEWVEVTGDEKEKLYSIIESALDTHWSNMSKGWCRTIVDRKSLDGQILQVDYSWDGNDLGMVLCNATEHFKNGVPVDSPQQTWIYGAKESWVFYPHRLANKMEGYGGTQLRKPGTYLDCHPRKIWLSVIEGQRPEFAIPKLFSHREGSQLFQSEDKQRVRFRLKESVLEFDARSDYSPVLFENSMDVEGVVIGKIPRREKYEVAQDIKGVWYCKRSESWVWRKGLAENPDHRVNVEVLEYLSDPPKNLMRLNYHTIGANAKTKVVSRVPRKSGTWRYGKGEVEKDEGENEMRQAAEKLRHRGFASEKRQSND